MSTQSDSESTGFSSSDNNLSDKSKWFSSTAPFALAWLGLQTWLFILSFFELFTFETGGSILQGGEIDLDTDLRSRCGDRDFLLEFLGLGDDDEYRRCGDRLLREVFFLFVLPRSLTGDLDLLWVLRSLPSLQVSVRLFAGDFAGVLLGLSCEFNVLLGLVSSEHSPSSEGLQEESIVLFKYWRMTWNTCDFLEY